MLSAAKHLGTERQMLRCAQHDSSNSDPGNPSPLAGSHYLLTSVSFDVTRILPRDELKKKHPRPYKQGLRYLRSPVKL